MRELIIHDSNENLIEVWAPVPIPGYHMYYVSTFGEIMNKDSSGLLSPDKLQNGYMRVSLSNNGVRARILVHRLVAITFIPLPNKFIKKHMTIDQLVVNHIDGNKTNNRVDNLEWVTVKENAEHARDTGLLKYMGENSHLAKMDNKTAEKCCKLLAKGKSFDYISKKLGISRKSVIHIKAGECWKNMSKKYIFPKNEQRKPNSIDLKVIHKICELLEERNYSDSEIGSRFGLSREYVRDIRLGKRQKKISKNYTFLSDIEFVNRTKPL